MKNKIEDLRDHLFITLEKLGSGEMTIEVAAAIANVAQVVVNSAKVEVDFLRVTDGSQGSGFIPEEPRPALGYLETTIKKRGN